MYLIVGLGNPGRQYEQTRHNAGFVMIDKFAEELGIKIKKGKFRALLGEGEFEGEKIILAKPQTFMNLSGEAVSAIVKFYKMPLQNVIVVYDDVYIKMGSLRVRFSGSSGGHNGMGNIIHCLGTEKVPRVRIGIGLMGENEELYDFVLGKFSDGEINVFEGVYTKLVEGIKVIMGA